MHASLANLFSFGKKSKNICINQRFFDAYCEAHEKKFGETFVWDTNTLIV
ncbi:hypothetical protein [Allisonella histaminiformans]